MRLTILHVDDDPAWIAVVRDALGAHPEAIYLGACAGGQAAVACASAAAPTAVIYHLGERGPLGFSAAAAIQRLPGAPRLLVLTGRRDEFLLEQVRSGRVQAVVAQQTFRADELRCALDHLRAGRPFLSASVRTALQAFQHNPVAFFKILSDREIGLLGRIGLGETDAEIAAQVRISRLTVKSHRNRIMAKLGMHCREKLIQWCVTRGFAEFEMSGEDESAPSRA